MSVRFLYDSATACLKVIMFKFYHYIKSHFFDRFMAGIFQQKPFCVFAQLFVITFLECFFIVNWWSPPCTGIQIQYLCTRDSQEMMDVHFARDAEGKSWCQVTLFIAFFIKRMRHSPQFLSARSIQIHNFCCNLLRFWQPLTVRLFPLFVDECVISN